MGDSRFAQGGGAVGWLVDRLHVSTPDEEVEADMRTRARRASMTPEESSSLVSTALDRHHQNQRDYQAVVSGRLEDYGK